jgi:hypothetical protein
VESKICASPSLAVAVAASQSRYMSLQPMGCPSDHAASGRHFHSITCGLVEVTVTDSM